MFVEDNEMVRRATAEILKRIGYSVVLAEDSKGALAVFEKETFPIDLLITDVIMPQMSGAELVSKIKTVRV
ncbi:MAG: response regulator [Thermodesulfobacteriota bacterium]|nr:response regulator [Thermodesulfobacteriota bacterium]